ncbi:ORF6C domain-containing protein [Bacillus sp. ISL-75]|uniref:ORF6C domain-containing protein n=1 Tax=Bacillus sp. ISL-75 TaxID=2819137 RepID=UPI001BEBFCFE|nr:ORF6C domain-containing protein [Bacillus sp. ISL-75]MBT2728372.1 ORF6C domain-containing protein [Bacillus sp. ISL-75]
MMPQHKNDLNPMELIKFNLKSVNETGQALVQHIEYVEAIKNDMDVKYTEVVDMVKEVRDSYTLTYTEQYTLQSIVFKTSIEFTKLFLEDEWYDLSQKERSKEVGKFRRAIWKKMKRKFNVPRYPSIRRIDFMEALEFVNNLRINDLELW